MRYYLPDIRIPTGAPPSGFVEKFGGLPWGLTEPHWPTCKECGGSQSLLAQLAHDEARLNLGRVGRVLFVFQCDHNPGSCATWDARSGANACFVVEPEELGKCESTLPDDSPPLNEELHIPGWVERDDGIAPHLAESFFAESKLLGLDDTIRDSVAEGTRLGSVPRWVQSADEGPGPDWHFLGQLNWLHTFVTPPGGQHPAVEWTREGEAFLLGPNFGDAGIAYLFLKPDGERRPAALMFWQCS